MKKLGPDRVTALAANMASPEVVHQIDEALCEMREDWLELLSLRKIAVRRHGELAPPPKTPEALTEPEEPQIDRGVERSSLSVSNLIGLYKTNAGSPYSKLRFRTRQNYDGLLRRIDSEMGTELIRDIDEDHIRRTYEDWTRSGTAMAHALGAMLRGLFTFGANVLKNKECRNLKFAMSEMNFQPVKAQSEPLTAEQVRAIIGQAHRMDLGPIAVAQAFQYDCGLRQRDVIGEWVPQNEPGDSDVNDGEMKWLRGIRWEEIDHDLILRHQPSFGGKMIELRLSEAPMVMTELARPMIATKIARRDLPQKGPIVVNKKTGLPYTGWEFRRLWREVADAVAIPKHVKNMNSRAPNED